MSLPAARAQGDASAAAILQAVEELQARNAPRIAAIAAGIQTDGAGNILSTPENIARVDELIAAMKSQFIDDEFVDAVVKYLETLDDITGQVKSSFEEFTVDPAVIDAIDRRTKAQTAAGLVDPESYPSLWINVADSLIYGVSVAAPVDTTVATIGEVTALSPAAGDVQGTVESTPIVMQRAQTAAAAEEAGVEFFLFQGRPIPTTRPWCREREGHVFHIEEIRQWGREAASGNGWEGMVEGTNEQTIFTYLGGWYGERHTCRHLLLPQPRHRVPEADLERMRKKGIL